MASDEVTRLVLRAQDCRNLAATAEDPRVAQSLREMAAEYQERAEGLMGPLGEVGNSQT